MKKVLLGSAVLTAMSLSIIAFQLSCSKTANAQTGGTNGLVQLNKIVYTTVDSPYNYHYSIWISNYDGTNPTKINVNLPSGVVLSISNSGIGDEFTKLSPDGKTLFFKGTAPTGSGIYSCNIDGSNVKSVLSNSAVLNSVN